MSTQQETATDPHAATRRQHLATQKMALRWTRKVDTALCFVVPTMKVAGLWALVWFARLVFGLRSPWMPPVIVAAVALWFWWALEQRGKEPSVPFIEDYRQRVRANEADARGHCQNPRCALCGGKPAPKGGA